MFEPTSAEGFAILEGYAQGNYGWAHGWVAVVCASNEVLLAAHIKWKRVRVDKWPGA